MGPDQGKRACWGPERRASVADTMWAPATLEEGTETLTFAEFAEAWLDHTRARVRPSTYRGYEGLMRGYGLRPPPGPTTYSHVIYRGSRATYSPSVGPEMSDAKLHHFVPQFLLRRFSIEPAEDAAQLWRLDKATGKTEQRAVRLEAAVTGYNDLLEAENIPKGYVEHALSLIEGEAAGIIGDLIEGQSIDPPQRVAMALFLYLQYQRTPRGRQWLTYTFEQSYTLDTMQRLLDPKQVQELHRLQGEEISLEEAERRGREWADQLDSGELILKAGQDHAVGAMFMFAEGAVPAIAGGMSWFVLHAPPGSDFIISDHPILLHDPTAPPGYGAGWLSSPETEATCPLDTTAALVAVPGPPEVQHVDARGNEVEELNLRTYASAEWAIYGRSPGVVQQVRAHAKKQKLRVAEFAPRPPTIHILEETEGEPMKVERLRPTGEVRRRQRWPRWED